MFVIQISTINCKFISKLPNSKTHFNFVLQGKKEGRFHQFHNDIVSYEISSV